jgi:hypothetical protein
MLGSELAYVQQAGGIRDVALANMNDPANPVITPITTSGDVIWGPGLSGDYLSYRRPGEVGLYDTRLRVPFRNLTAPGTGRAALSTALVAWEQDAAGGSDVAWLRLGLPGEVPIVMARAGSQRSVAVSFGWIAYIDDDSGSVHLLDTTRVDPADPQTFVAADVRVFQGSTGGVGKVLDVAIWASIEGSAPRLAITVDAGAMGAEIIVLDPGRTDPVALTTPGGKLNAHLQGEWVAYEDFSTGISQVRLWEWPTGRLFYAAMTGAPQTLNQLVTADTALTVIWTAMGTADLDIFQFTLGLPLPPETGGGAVKCSDAAPVVLADFTVAPRREDSRRSAGHDDSGTAPHAGGEQDRGNGQGDGDGGGDCQCDGHDRGKDGWHVGETGAHDERCHSGWKWRAFGGARFDADVPRHVLVCIDATDVTSAWVGVGSEVVAAPADFHMGTLALEARLTVAADDGRAGAVVIARPGGRLRVRVLDDPGGSASDGTTCSARGDCPPPPAGLLSKLGCGSSGGAGGLASLLLTGLVAGWPLRRRRRS